MSQLYIGVKCKCVTQVWPIGLCIKRLLCPFWPCWAWHMCPDASLDYIWGWGPHLRVDWMVSSIVSQDITELSNHTSCGHLCDLHEHTHKKPSSFLYKSICMVRVYVFLIAKFSFNKYTFSSWFLSFDFCWIDNFLHSLPFLCVHGEVHRSYS